MVEGLSQEELVALAKKELARQARDRSYREANRDRINERNRAYNKTYYERNKEKLNETSRAYLKAHPDKRREYSRRYKETHREKVREYQREYNKTYCKANRARFGQIGAMIREYRKGKAITVREMGEALGVSRTTISLWEQGSYAPNLEKIRAVYPDLGKLLEEKMQPTELEPPQTASTM